MVFDTAKIRSVDLSHEVIPMTAPVGPDQIAERVGVEGVIWPIEEYGSYVDNSVYQVVKFKSHLKTHIETPYHQFPEFGRCISDYPPETFYGRCVHLHFDVKPGTIITYDMVKELDNGRMREGDIVIAHTTVDENLMSSVFKAEVEIPHMSLGFAEYLIEKKVKLLGFDNSVECGHFMKDKDGNTDRAHDLLLRNDIPLLEMITNMNALTQDVCFLMALPGLNKVKGLDASPAQVVALEGFEVI